MDGMENIKEIVSITRPEDCVEEFQLSVECVKNISSGLTDLRSHFLRHMDRSYLSYDIEIGGKEYNVRPAFTLDEQLEQKRIKKDIFSIMAKLAFSDFIDSLEENDGANTDHSAFRFILHPMRVERHDLLMDRIAKDKEDLHQDTQVFSENYEDILSKNPKYFKEQAYKFIHEGPDFVDEEILELATFRRVLHNYMISAECTAERDRLFNMKTVDYFPELIKELDHVNEDTK